MGKSKNLDSLISYLNNYFKNRPLFLGLIRAKELELFKRKAKIKGRALDFGCGDGWFAKLLTKNPDRTNLSMIGLEVDKKAAERARETGVYKKVVVYDGGRIPFADNYFDTIVSNCVLEHVRNTRTREHKNIKTQDQAIRKSKNQNLEMTINEIYRVLKPGGRFYTTVMTDKWEEYLFGNLFLGSLYKKWMSKIQEHYSLLNAKDWQKTFESAGFGIESVAGYLDRRASRWIDFLHYISIGSLISYKLIGKWVLFPCIFDLLPVGKCFSNLIKDDVSPSDSAALFFILEKSDEMLC